jgi:ATP-dependent exoDNAse (exonuclease V) alpha subunit
MADTLSLDTAIQYAIDRGASVRLIGDDQQLAAIGAGGILRDIKHTHDALHLGELHRFTNPAEAAASLALRDGDPRALAFYLDHRRVHVGDLAKATEDAFTAWVADPAAGLDAIHNKKRRVCAAPLRNVFVTFEDSNQRHWQRFRQRRKFWQCLSSPTDSVRFGVWATTSG